MKLLTTSTTSIFLFCILLFLGGIASTNAADYPVLPQVYISTAFNLPTGGQRFTVSTTSGFKSALSSANLGDIIELEAGKIFTGPFDLPNKLSGNGWIYIISSAYSRLPNPCTRVRPTDAANMPKIVVNAGSGGTINTNPSAHHYRFVGIEFAPVDGKFVYNVIQLGNGEKTENTQPNNIIIDRCYVHGDPIAGSRRGVLMNGASIAVVDSYISDCKEEGADSQALAGYSGTGPIKIVNNYLEGAGENVMFGGADPSIPNAVPSDIEIRWNTFFKPLSWMSEKWSIKNLCEFKNAQRVLLEGNHFENNWPQSQNGFALLLTPRNQNNTAPWSVVQDITIRFNTFLNIAQGFNILGRDAPNVSQRTARILIQNNIVQVTNLGKGGDGRLYQVLGGPTDVIFDHNTGFCTNAYLVCEGSTKIDNFVFQNNIVNHGTYGFIGTGTAYANTTLAMYFNPNWTITSNVDIGGSATQYPTGNYFPSTIASVGFNDYAGGDYRLKSGSPFKNKGTDGKDLGADIDSLAIASIYQCEGTSGVVDDYPHQAAVTAIPKPADSYVTFFIPKASAQPVHFMVYDLYGHSIITGNSDSEILRITTSDLASGIYFVKIIAEGGAVSVHKILVRH